MVLSALFIKYRDVDIIETLMRTVFMVFNVFNLLGQNRVCKRVILAVYLRQETVRAGAG